MSSESVGKTFKKYVGFLLNGCIILIRISRGTVGRKNLNDLFTELGKHCGNRYCFRNRQSDKNLGCLVSECATTMQALIISVNQHF